MASSDATLRAYYDASAAHYDEAYDGVAPPWVDSMVADLRHALRGRRVLEIACGTGHWTRHAAEAAASVTAVDAAPAMKAIAAAKLAGLANVTIADADAYDLPRFDGLFTSGLAMQWLSHVPAARRHAFFTGWHSRLAPGSVVFLADNQLTERWADLLRPAPGSEGGAGTDTYEPRELPDGPSHLILKNYFTEPGSARSSNHMATCSH